MRTSTLLRIVALCAAPLLIAGLVGRPAEATRVRVLPISGAVLGSDGISVSGATVRFYRATGDESAPWSLQTTASSDQDHGQFVGLVPRGFYRITVNETDDHSGAWDVYQPATWSSSDGSTELEVTDQPRSVGYIRLAFRAGTLSGTVLDHCGQVVDDGTVEAYDPAHPEDGPSSVSTIYRGNYRVHALADGAQLRFVTPSQTIPGWWSDAFHGVAVRSIDDATIVSSPLGTDTHLPDAVVRRDIRPRPDQSPVNVGGTLATPTDDPVAGVAVRYYRLADENDTVGVLAASTVSRSGSQIGAYSVELQPGTYRVTYAEDEALGTSATWEAQERATKCVSVDSYDYNPHRLAYRQGTITGTVVDHTGAPVPYALVEAYIADGTQAGTPPVAIRVKASREGAYTIHGASTRTRLRFVAPSARSAIYSPVWLGGGTSFTTSPSITTAADGAAPVSVAPITLPLVPLHSYHKPVVRVRGAARPGATVSTDGGEWRPHKPVRLTKFQWYRSKRTDSTRLIRISGQTRSTYRARSSDVGYYLYVRVMAAYTGAAGATALSSHSQRIRK